MMVLGLVQWLAPVHGYDVRRELLSWRADEWGNVQPGSIYHALRKMAEEGLLTEVGTERVGARPARTTYGITPGPSPGGTRSPGRPTPPGRGSPATPPTTSSGGPRSSSARSPSPP
jgi:hypothetical protein